MNDTANVRRLLFRVFLSLLVSGVFVWLSLRHTDLLAVPRAMAAASRLPLLGGYANAIGMLQSGQQVGLGLLFWLTGPVAVSGLLRANDAVAQPDLNRGPALAV